MWTAFALVGVALPGSSAVAQNPAQPTRNFDNPASHETGQQFAPANVQRQDTPNDPSYDQSEPDTVNSPRSTNLYDERFDLFGFPSALSATTAKYHDSQQGHMVGDPMVSGYNAAGAWKLERGRRDVTVAILDTGIRWNELGLRDKIHLNTGELPLPEKAGARCTAPAGANPYDCNGDGVVNVEDYAQDPRVTAVIAQGYSGRDAPTPPTLVTGQDLIHAFGDCQIDPGTHLVVPGTCGAGKHYDNDHSGYANDIAGWNFFDNTNDPTDRSSYFAASNHGSGRAGDAAEQGNDGQGSIGVCPHCQVMPVRVWDTFVSDGNTFGLGITYATDRGAQVIEGADGNLYHSAFTERASQYAYDHGAVQTYSGDDLNTANHNYPANYGHAMLIQGTVPDTVGLGQNAPGPPSGTPSPLAVTINQIVTAFKAAGGGTNAPPGTYFRGANTTQYGGKSSISMEGATGSINTGRASGAAGLVISAAMDHGIALHPDETREILEQTAERVTSANVVGAGSADPGADPTKPPNEQWTTHFGWGRANLGAAVGVAASGKIPPEAAIDSPDWYAPLTGRQVQITGLARARFAAGGQFHWKLRVGAGLAPTSYTTVREGNSSTSVTDFGPIDLNMVRAQLAQANLTPAALDPGGPVFSPTSPSPFAQQFTVQLEVTNRDIPPTMGIDRRVLTTFADPTLRSGYPKRLGTGGEAPIRYADLNGDNVPELIVPTEDGQVHAYEPDGSELAGWPVRTGVQSAAVGHSGAAALGALGAPNEPPRGPVIADLDSSGRPDVITAAGTHIYAWHGDGTPVAGFPVQSDLSLCTPDKESQPLHHPKCGFLATPALAHLEGKNRPPDIVAPALDGHLYAFHSDGTPVPGFPVALVDPKENPQVIAESINEPAVGDLTGNGRDDVVVSTNEVYGAPSAGSDVSFSGALGRAAGGSTRVYAVKAEGNADPSAPNKPFLAGWPISLPGIIQNVLPLIGPGQDPAIASVNGVTQIFASATGGSLDAYTADGKHATTIQQNAYGPGSNAVDKSGSLNLFESASLGDLLGSGRPDVVKYQVSLNQAVNLLLVGQNQPYNHLIGAFDAASGAPLPSYPTVTDDYQFLSSSNIAKVDPASPVNQVLAGTGLGLLHAYDGATGLDAPQFPKQTGGWLFAPAALSDDGRLADITREGFLFEWSSKAPKCQPSLQWPSFRHDPQSSGNLNHDGTPPDAVAKLTLTALGGGRYQLGFVSPGDDGPCGTPHAFITRVDGQLRDLGLGSPPAGGTPFSAQVTLPSGAHTLSIQAQDGAGNLGYPVTVALPQVPGSILGSGGPGACIAGGRLRYRINPVPHGRVVKLQVYVNGHRVLTRRARRITHVSFRRPLAASFTVKVVSINNRGGRVISRRRYTRCGELSKKSHVKRHHGRHARRER